MESQIRILIADDHALMREGLKQLFALVPDVRVAAEAEDDRGIMDQLARRTEIDLLLLDMTMPGLNGEDLIAHVRKRHPELPILVLSMHNELQIVRRALKAGANGYVTKDQEPETLLTAIRKIADGGRFIAPVLAEQMAFEVSYGVAKTTHSCLSKREFQVLRMLARGASVNEVAARLEISNKTVSTHKARLMRKMGFTSNAELVCYAISNGLTDD